MGWAENFVTIVNGVGFPIVVCVFWCGIFTKRTKEGRRKKKNMKTNKTISI